ncbi:hypothetical protein GCM10009682_47250 [Luedemannella flava]|uniref:Uncharacterized protein n=1 Tax=Luedemannella flava TaxID=349316 RepID=A0ABP4YNG5_9ACTN
MNAAAELAALRAALIDLATWAHTHLNTDYGDRQYIAEHLYTAMEALATGDKVPAPPY